MFCSNCGKELIGDEKFCPKCGHPVATNTGIDISEEEKQVKAQEHTNIDIDKPKHPKNKINIGLFILGIPIFIVILSFLFSSESFSPRKPQELECVNYKNLCIATTDVLYDYTTIKTRTPGYPTFNKEWNNGWASAQKACEAWGGRLPYMEEFVTIVDAYNNHKIKLEDYKTYLSNTQINTYRIWAYSHDSSLRSGKNYDTKSIYDTAIAIDKSGDHIITGDYHTGTGYTWNARCVKDIDDNITKNNIKPDKPLSKSKSNSMQQLYESASRGKNPNMVLSSKALSNDMNHYNNGGGSLYGVAMYTLEDIENSENPHKELNLKYINLFIKNYDCLYKRFDINYCGIKKIIIYDDEYENLTETTKSLINALNTIFN